MFAVNCGPDGSPNSFTNFKNAALAQGAAAASSASGYPGASAASTATVTSSAMPSAGAGPQIHKVIVGGSNLTYSPSSIVAQPNDIVMFEL